MNVENFSVPDFRSDIRDSLPDDLSWCIAEIEDGDVDAFFIISTADWMDISGGSYRVSDIAKRLNIPSNNCDTLRIRKDIQQKLTHLDSGGTLDTKLIAITHDHQLTGPFTFIEGNRRSVAFTVNRSLVGIKIFIGVSPLVTSYIWANRSYQI